MALLDSVSPGPEPVERATRAEGVYLGSAGFWLSQIFKLIPFDEELVKPLVEHNNGARLRCICGPGAGFEKMPIDYLSAHAIFYSNTPGAVAETTAAHTVRSRPGLSEESGELKRSVLQVILVLTTLRGTTAAERSLRRGEWISGGSSVANKTLGRSVSPLLVLQLRAHLLTFFTPLPCAAHKSAFDWASLGWVALGEWSPSISGTWACVSATTTADACPRPRREARPTSHLWKRSVLESTVCYLVPDQPGSFILAAPQDNGRPLGPRAPLPSDQGAHRSERARSSPSSSHSDQHLSGSSCVFLFFLPVSLRAG